MRFRSILAPAFLVLCLAATALVVATRRNHQGSPMQGFTLYITQTAYPSSGDPILSATKVRQQKSDGSWKTMTTYSNGRVDVSFGEPGRGVYAVDEHNQRLEYLSGASGRPLADVDWSKQPGFAGEEMILGYKTYRIHWESDGNYTDSYMCPALQGFPLKLVSGGTRSKTVWETTQVIAGEPTFEPAPDLPVSMKGFEAKTKP